MVSLERVLSSENTPAPLSMFNEDGSLIACVKSDFLHNFERMCETEVTKMETTHCIIFGLNNIYFEKLSHTYVQTEQSGFGRKLQACKDHLPVLYCIILDVYIVYIYCIIFDAMAVIQVLPVLSKTMNITFVDMAEQFRDYIIHNSHIYAGISQVLYMVGMKRTILKSNTSKKRRQCLGTEDSLQPGMTVPKEWKNIQK